MSLTDLPGGRIKVRWRDAAGSHRAKTFTPKTEPNARKRRRLAQDYERQKMREVTLGLPTIIDPRKTLSDVVVDSFLPVVVDKKAPKTQALYKSLWNAHIQPAFGSHPVSRITPAEIEEWLAGFDGKEVTQRKALVLLGQMFKFAQKREWAVANPCLLVDKPKAPTPEPVKPPAPLEVERIRRMLLEAGREAEATFVALVAYAGLRPFGEALALTRGDVRERTILVRDRKRNRVRAVGILSPLAEDLKLWMSRSLGFDNAPLVPHRSGGFWTLTQYKNWRGRDVWPELADFPPKDMRHTFVSLLIRDEDYSRREIADQAGHSLEVQDRVYSHCWAELRGTGSAVGAIRKARAEVFGTQGEAEAGTG